MFTFLSLRLRLVFLDLERSIHLGGEVNLRIFNRLVSTINGSFRLVAPYESFTACFPMCRVNCNSGCALGCHLGPFYPVHVGSTQICLFASMPMPFVEHPKWLLEGFQFGASRERSDFDSYIAKRIFGGRSKVRPPSGVHGFSQ